MKKTLTIKTSHPFHIVSPSPWPILASLSLLATAMTLMANISKNSLSKSTLILITTFIAMNSFLWWRDLTRESSMQGTHSKTVMNLLKSSMIMFILSEVMLFFSLFWAFFHSSISPNIELGMNWPPVNINVFNPMSMPLLNSMILLSSGATITWSHHSFLKNEMKMATTALMTTISLGIMFTMFQGIEYYNSQFSMSDSVYGSTFFLATGFHGLHVIIGTMFLSSSLKSMISMMNSSNHFIMFDLSAWYWHFVDVVWLFLFTSIYWWGSM